MILQTPRIEAHFEYPSKLLASPHKYFATYNQIMSSDYVVLRITTVL